MPIFETIVIYDIFDRILEMNIFFFSINVWNLNYG
jgi:hypothetical protein